MKKNLRIKAYEAIKNKIVHFALRPGDKVFENDIAKSLKMSRTPVREALLMLEKEGLVICDPRIGYMVNKLTVNEIEEYLSLRETLELFAAPMILDRITASDIEALKDNIDKALSYAEEQDFQKISNCESKFHEILYRATKSSIFFHTISSLIDRFSWLRAISLRAPGGVEDSIAGHRKIIKALEDKDFEGA